MPRVLITVLPRQVILCCMVGLVAYGLLARPTVAQSPAEIGYRDFSWAAPGIESPTKNKPQSKLWFNDGIWWGSLFNPAADAFRIYRFDRSAQRWHDSGTTLDDRNHSHADTLWTGTHLYVASAGHDPASPYDSARLYRFSYDPAAQHYRLDAGFPVTIVEGGMEAIVLARDTTGKLWATFTRHGHVYVNRSSGTDHEWGAAFVLPGMGTRVSDDDISAVVAWDRQIGVMWSNQLDDAIYFATHDDADPDDRWQTTRTLLAGSNEADDHISLRALHSGSGGMLFAVVKTSHNDAVNPDPAAPLIRVLIRSANGDWSNVIFGRVADDHTRPMLLIDEQHRQLYVFATTPEAGGAIVYKRSSLDQIAFPEGRGTPFIEGSAGTQLNNPTSTKQNLDSTTDLLVLASDDRDGYYYHNMLSLDRVQLYLPLVRAR